MTYTEQVGKTNLRKEVVDEIIKGFATAAYKFKQAVTISPTSAWTNIYYRENPTALSGPTGNAIRGIPRGANFPQAVVNWEKVSSVIEKYGLEDNIFWEDILSDDIAIQARTMFRIAEGVAKAVDDQIWAVLTESQVATNINGFTVGSTLHWSGTSAAIINDLMRAKQLISENNYSTENLMCFLSPKDHRSVVQYLAGKGAQFPTIGNDVASNGRVGKLVGIDLIQSNSVTASFALVVVPKICATWKELVPLTTDITTDPYKSVRIRSVEQGVCQLTDPKAVCLIANTQGNGSE